MKNLIKSEKEKGVYYIRIGSNSKNWIYYCKFRWRNKLYNYRNLTEEFSVRSEKEAAKKIEVLKDEARKALELGLPNPLERKRIKELEKANKLKEKSIRTISEHWKYEIVNYKNKRRPNTVKQYENFYKNYIEPFLGNKKPSEIKTKDIDKILFESNLAEQTDPYRSLLKRLLRPIMAKAKADGEISESVVEAYKFDLKLIPKKKKISRRTKKSHLEISKKLFNQIGKYVSQYKVQREEWQQIMYLQLLCGRRYGELFELTSENIDYQNKRINVFEENNKSKVDTSFPIPEECQEFILSITSGKIFKEIKLSAYYGVFQRMKTLALGEDNFDLTAHDVRSLFISSLVALGEDSRKADYMLDHKQKGEEIVHFYLDLSEESCDNAFKKYWDALRN